MGAHCGILQHCGSLGSITMVQPAGTESYTRHLWHTVKYECCTSCAETETLFCVVLKHSHQGSRIEMDIVLWCIVH